MRPSALAALTFIAGFCDTATFIHMDGVFSAHVTGNFVLFAAALAEGLAPGDYLKILTFPVFIAAVICGTLLHQTGARGQKQGRRLLWAMALILALCALCAVALQTLYQTINLGLFDTLITLAVVLALGIQNSMHHFLKGPMTTVMTGTVMNTTARLTRRLILRETPELPQISDKTGVSAAWLITGFALGCVSGGYLTVSFGLASTLMPALVMIFILYVTRPQRDKETP